MTNPSIVSEIRTFLRAVNMKPTRLGKAALGDGNFVREICEEGRSMTLRTEERLRAFMEEYKREYDRIRKNHPETKIEVPPPKPKGLVASRKKRRLW